MSPPNTAYSALLLIAGMTCLFVAAIVTQTRRGVTGAYALITLLLALAWWDITYAVFWAGTPGFTKYFWLDITYIGVVMAPAALFVFSLQLTHKQGWFKRPLAILIYLEPVFVLISLFTDPYHGLFFAGKREESSGLILNGGPVFWLNLVYSYVLILLATLFIARGYFGSSGIYRKQLGVILVGILLTWLNSIIFLLKLNPLPGADNTPFSFTLTAVAFAFAIVRYQLLDLLPVARDRLVEKMEDGVLVIDTQDRIVDMNPAAQKLLNINANMFGRPVEEAIAEWRHYEKITSNFKQAQIEIGLGGRSKKQLDMQVTSIKDGRGRDVGRLIILHDVTGRKLAEAGEYQQRILAQALQETSQALNSTLDYESVLEKILINVGRVVPIDSANIALLDEHGLLRYVRFHGYMEHKVSEDELQNFSLETSPIFRRVFETGEPIIIPDTRADPDWITIPSGAWIRSFAIMPIRIKSRVVGYLNLDSAVAGFYTPEHIHNLRAFADQVAIAVENARFYATAEREIMERKQVEEKLQKLSRAVEQSPASIVITDTAGRIEYVNPRFTEVTGYSAEEVIGSNPRVLKTDKTPRDTYRQLWQALTSGSEWRGEFINRKKNGEEYYEFASISPIMNDQGIVTHYLAVKEDITGQKMAEKELRNKNQILQFQLEAIEKLQAELREQVIRDPLTGLYNRRYLVETQERELAHALREGYKVGFVMVDIDHFKKVNDTFGHEVGDQVLRQLAAVIKDQTRLGDIVCRYGGEEILVILLNVTAETAFQITDRWRIAFMNSNVPVEFGQAKCTISCGISIHPTHGGTANELITLADKAMYQAKAAGRNRVVTWNPEY